MKGLRVEILDKTGRFARVRYIDGTGAPFFVYKSDLGIPEIAKESTPAGRAIERSTVSVTKITNTTDYGVSLIKGQPTVSVHLKAGKDLFADFTIRKDKLVSGFSGTIHNQKGDAFQAGGKYKDILLGLGEGDSFELKILTLDRSKRLAEFEISADWPECDIKKRESCRILSSKFSIKGRDFDELMRQHTSTEMRRTIE